MRSLIYYLQRWNLTNASYLIKNMISSTLIFMFACYAVRNGVFEVYGDTKSCLFTLLMCAIWSGIFNSIALFYSEADYTLDDLNKIVTVKVYVIANFLIQIFLCVVEGVICTTIFYFFYDYDFSGLFFRNANFDFMITFILIILSADMLGFATGMLVSNITTAMTFIPVLLIIQFLFSGCLFELDSFLKPLARFTTAKWGYSALGSVSRLNDLLLEMNPLETIDPIFKATKGNLLNCWGNLLILTIVFVFIAGILLYRKINYGENN